MRQRRIERGALTLASAEVKFQIDTETHDPLDIGMSDLSYYFELRKSYYREQNLIMTWITLNVKLRLSLYKQLKINIF